MENEKVENNEKFVDKGKLMYNNFVQVTLEHPYMLALIKEKPSAATTFMLLVSLMSAYNKVIISKEAIIEALELTNIKSAERSLNYLIKHRYIYKTDKDTYVINPYVCCKTSKTKIMNCDIDLPQHPIMPNQLDGLKRIRKTVGEYKIVRRRK